MKHTSLRVLMIVTIVSASLACSTLLPTEAPPTPNYIFTPSLVKLVIEPGSLPGGQVGAAYEARINVRDMVTPISSMSISDGTLPPGLELVFVDGEDGATLSGVPTETGTYTFTVFVACFATMVVGQSGQREYVVVVE